MLEGKDEDLISRVRGLPEIEIANTHYNAAEMKRRLKTYRLANNSEVADPSVSDFFEQQCMSVFRESIKTTEKDALNSFKIYIERNEKPFNFMTYDNVDEIERRKLFDKALIVEEEKVQQKDK